MKKLNKLPIKPKSNIDPKLAEFITNMVAKIGPKETSKVIAKAFENLKKEQDELRAISINK